jgi:small subunit ribosomal protein S6e
MNFKFVISDGKQSFQVEKDQKECPLIGKKIGESLSGDFLGLNGYELVITGGSDKDGFPMRRDVEGLVKKRIVMTRGIGFKGEYGLRRRKMLRGNTIGLDIVQINCNVTKKGSKPLEELLGKKEKPGEGAKEEAKEEAKPEKEDSSKEVKAEEAKPKEEIKEKEKPEKVVENETKEHVKNAPAEAEKKKE